MKKIQILVYTKHGILDLRKGESGKRPYYLRGHLLNANLNGPNDWKNLTPLSRTGNASHLAGIESKLKLALPNEGHPEFKAFKYVVIPDYSRGKNQSLIDAVSSSQDEYVEANKDTIVEIVTAERFVPISLRVESVELENVGGKWVDKSDSPYNIKDTIFNLIGTTPQDYKVTNERVYKYPVKFKEMSDANLAEAGFGSATITALMNIKNDEFLEVSNHDQLYSEVIKRVTGVGGRVKKETLIKKINF